MVVLGVRHLIIKALQILRQTPGVARARALTEEEQAEMMEQMVSSNPMLKQMADSNPQVKAMISNPQMMKQMLQNMSTFEIK